MANQNQPKHSPSSNTTENQKRTSPHNPDNREFDKNNPSRQNRQGSGNQSQQSTSRSSSSGNKNQ